MSNAFRCDHCEEFHDGRPAEKLLVRSGPRRDTSLRAELCETCSEDFAGGPPEPADG